MDNLHLQLFSCLFSHCFLGLCHIPLKLIWWSLEHKGNHSPVVSLQASFNGAFMTAEALDQEYLHIID